MKIVADDKIPFLQGVFEPYADVIYRKGSAISPEDLRDADVLITRTRTKCGKALLAGSKIRFIATATIGYDHIDTAYCQQNGIGWKNAPGCNASSVAQYIASILLHNGTDLRGKAIGIIGVGNVGKKVAALCRTLGMRVLLNDPPRERIEGKGDFLPLEALCREADYLTLHVPLNMAGPDKTYHLADSNFFRLCAKKPLFINASRGETTDPEALTGALLTKRLSGAVLDVWEDEPDINPGMLKLLRFGTPHIAGYSADGKANGTAAAVRAVADFLRIDALKDFYPQNVPLPPCPVITLNSNETALRDAMLATYDIAQDDARLRANPENFEALRGNYPLRREPCAYQIAPASRISGATRSLLRELGFRIDA